MVRQWNFRTNATCIHQKSTAAWDENRQPWQNHLDTCSCTQTCTSLAGQWTKQSVDPVDYPDGHNFMDIQFVICIWRLTLVFFSLCFEGSDSTWQKYWPKRATLCRYTSAPRNILKSTCFSSTKVYHLDKILYWCHGVWQICDETCKVQLELCVQPTGLWWKNMHGRCGKFWIFGRHTS